MSVGQEGAGTELSLWLMPSAESDWLAGVVREIAFRHGTPVFAPHVTVVGGFRVPEAEAVAALTAWRPRVPLPARFPDVGFEHVIVRALYLRAQPSEELHQLHNEVESRLGLPRSRYSPHLSLMYSDAAESIRRGIAEQLRLPLPVAVRFDSLALWRTPAGRFSEWAELARVGVDLAA